MFGKKRKRLESEVATLKAKYDLIRHEALFNVDMFNDWFNSDKPSEIYAHSGIFLRLDKLSDHHFIDYMVSYGVTKTIAHDFFHENYRMFYKFEDSVRKDWRIKQNERV